MSHDIGGIAGCKEAIASTEKREVSYKDNNLKLTSFWGGTQRGKCLQLSLNEDYIQLTKSEVVHLRALLNKWIAEE